MLLNDIIIGITIGNIVLMITAMLMIMKLRKFESNRLKNMLNLVVIGLGFYMILIIIDVVNYLNMLAGVNLGNYIGILNNAAVFFVMPLIIICFLAAVFVLRDVY